jgi:hypothetical protein
MIGEWTPGHYSDAWSSTENAPNASAPAVFAALLAVGVLALPNLTAASALHFFGLYTIGFMLWHDAEMRCMEI